MVAPKRHVAVDSEHVVIAMCTHNGAEYLQDQLDSFSRQTHENWSLWVSDDASSDSTHDILREFALSHDVHVVNGPRAGAAANYMALITRSDLTCSMIALSDQDDIWAPDKLARGVAALKQIDVPVIYGAGSIHVASDLRPIGRSRLPPPTADFRHALLQNAVSGHTAMLNQRGLELVRLAGRPRSLAYHDWWLYQLICGCGGTVILDQNAVLRYRQHGNNALGAHRGIRARLNRSTMLLDGTYGRMLREHLAALHSVRHLLEDVNAEITDHLISALNHSGLEIAQEMRRLRLFRQSSVETVAVLAAASLGFLSAS